MAAAPTPVSLKLRRGSRVLEVAYADDTVHALPFEYLRVYSPSAEVRGHGQGEPMLVGGKRAVGIAAVEPVGRYAVRLRFDDGHASGLFSWEVLDQLIRDRETLWARYLARLGEHGMDRDSDVTKLSALGVRTVTPR